MRGFRLAAEWSWPLRFAHHINVTEIEFGPLRVQLWHPWHWPRRVVRRRVSTEYLKGCAQVYRDAEAQMSQTEGHK